MLPARRKRQRSGIERVPERRYPAHLKWVRGFECSAIGETCSGPIAAAHVRGGNTGGGMGSKPPDWWVIALCTQCHIQQHAMGERRFEKLAKLDMKAKAIEFAKASPVKEVREMAGVRL